MQNLIHVQPEEDEYKLSGNYTVYISFTVMTFCFEVATKFRDGWKHPSKRLPVIKRIFYVAYSGPGLIHLAKFSDYR